MASRGFAALLVAGTITACAGPVSPTPVQPTISSNAPGPASGSPSATPSLGTPSASTPASSASPPASFDPATSADVTNVWFPLAPGMKLTYRGTKDGKRAVDVVTVSDQTRNIAGVVCRLVEDRLTLDGRLEERTTDYYTQDVDGNVWYFGEDTAELDKAGNVTSREGTWHAGVDGAQPGIFMQATPTIGASFVQELYVGHAEDHFQVLSLSSRSTVPYGSFSGVLRTKEWTPLEPDVIDNKYYVRAVGEIREVSRSGPYEELRLVSFSHR